MSEKMLAAVYYGPDDLRVEERLAPEIGPQEALLKVAGAGICGTDLRILHGMHGKYPSGTVRIPGHEVTGDIVRVGKQVNGLEVGQRVFVAPNVGCGRCRQCITGNNNLCASYQAPGINIDGAFAEFMRIPAEAILQGNLIVIDEGIDPAVATLIEPLACVYRGQRPLHIQPGESVLVIGAGPVGLMHVMLAQLQGAGKVMVSELIVERAAQAGEFGANRVIIPGEEDLEEVVAEETHGAGADVVIVAAPSGKAQEMALKCAAIGGRINFFGGLPKDSPTINLNSNLIHYKELIVTGTTASSTYDCRQAAEIVTSGRLDIARLIGARYPLKDALAAFRAAEGGKSLKVVIEP